MIELYVFIRPILKSFLVEFSFLRGLLTFYFQLTFFNLWYHINRDKDDLGSRPLTAGFVNMIWMVNHENRIIAIRVSPYKEKNFITSLLHSTSCDLFILETLLVSSSTIPQSLIYLYAGSFLRIVWFRYHVFIFFTKINLLLYRLQNTRFTSFSSQKPSRSEPTTSSMATPLKSSQGLSKSIIFINVTSYKL